MVERVATVGDALDFLLDESPLEASVWVPPPAPVVALMPFNSIEIVIT